ncbi:PDDEXK family nuclease [Paenibacillus tarimensis]|uniref:hypothetical protein n=1 Tax=Paenibacillus tarimensis TaxID=416012 RepID=UPI001F442953|nr:hypothetical protein [Paenibacillus tarimensis]MCF2945445.1 hypothetical protein [Paenibacillus tarimensis]
MKTIGIKKFIEKGKFTLSDEYKKILADIGKAINSIEHPAGSGGFYLFPKIDGNGVVPIKDAFIKTLDSLGWQNENVCSPLIKKRRFDSSYSLGNDKFFAIEWETGNISSSHRALNRLILGILDGVLEGGILVLPSRNMYQYLTQRTGNFKELEPYFPVWDKLAESMESGILLIIEIEHDGVSEHIPPLPKGKDGRAREASAKRMEILKPR